MIGIYGIKNKINGKIYIGQSKNIKSRYSNHVKDLRKNKHNNKHLQLSWNKYGENNFELLILAECSIDELPIKEQEWINKHDRKSLYNQLFEVHNHQGAGNPFFGKKHTVLSKERMSKWKKENYNGSNNPNFGKQWNKEQRDKMRGSKNCNSKLTEKEVIEIKKMLFNGIKHADIAEKFGVARTVITRINSGTRWSHVKMEV